MKKMLPWLIAAVCVLGTIVLTMRTCRADAALAKAKADYAEMVRVTEAANAMSLDRIAALEAESVQYVEKISTFGAEIAARDKTIAALKGKVTDATAEAARLRTEVQPVIDANPALREFVASLDAGILLRDTLIEAQTKQIATLTAQGIVKDQRFEIQVKLTDEWRGNYDREHGLRLAAEGLFKISERGRKMNKLITRVAVGAAAGVVLYTALAK